MYLRTQRGRWDPTDLLARLKVIEKAIDKISTVQFDIHDADRTKLVDTLTRTLEERLNNEAFKSIDEAFAKRALETRRWESLITDFAQIKERLIQEANNLTRRTNVNLALGSLTTVLAGLGLVVIVMLKPLELSGLTKEEYGWRIMAH